MLFWIQCGPIKQGNLYSKMDINLRTPKAKVVGFWGLYSKIVGWPTVLQPVCNIVEVTMRFLTVNSYVY